MREERPYQINCHNAVISAFNLGKKRQLIVKATGTGKTFTIVKLIEKMGFKRVLWGTHTEELCDQSALAFIEEKFDKEFASKVENVGFVNYISNGGKFPDGFDMGLIKASTFKKTGNVVIASMQTLHKRLHLINTDEFDCFVCDEAHLFLSPSFIKSIDYFQPQLLIGCTATDFRADGLLLINTFEEKTFEYDISQAVKEGYLCEIDAIRVATKVNLDSVHTMAGDFNQKELADEIDTLARNNLVVDSYIKYALGRKGLFFCCNIEHCLHLAEAFQQKGIKATAVSSDEELTGDRSAKIQAYKNGEIDVLINVNILTTGFNEPDTGVIGCVSPTKSKTKYIQMIGRGTRLKSNSYVEKFGQNVIILDFVDATNRHNIINCHELEKELPPEDRVFISKEKQLKLIEERAKKSAKLEHSREEDERVKLIALPKIKVNKSIRMREPATDAQLKAIERWGYDIVNIHYTKQMINEIFMQQSASDKQIYVLGKKGFDVSKGVSKAQAAAAFKILEEKGLI